MHLFPVCIQTDAEFFFPDMSVWEQEKFLKTSAFCAFASVSMNKQIASFITVS